MAFVKIATRVKMKTFLFTRSLVLLSLYKILGARLVVLNNTQMTRRSATSCCPKIRKTKNAWTNFEDNKQVGDGWSSRNQGL